MYDAENTKNLFLLQNIYNKVPFFCVISAANAFRGKRKAKPETGQTVICPQNSREEKR